MAFINDILHADSKYYDPVKAHEYYERTKQLKGYGDRSALKSEKKKQGWDYVKNQSNEAKRAELDQAREAHKKEVESLRNGADAKRKAIRERLAQILEQVSAKSETKRKEIEIARDAQKDEIARKLKENLADVARKQKEQLQQLAVTRANQLAVLAKRRKEELARIAKETERKIDALPDIPSYVSDDEKAKLSSERARALAKIRGDSDSKKEAVNESINKEKQELTTKYTADRDTVRESGRAQTDSIREAAATERDAATDKAATERATVSKDTAGEKKTNRDTSNSTREQVSTALKASVDSARKKYDTLKQSLKAKYEQEQQSEYEAIKKLK